MGLKACYMESYFLVLLLATCHASPSPIRPRPNILVKEGSGDPTTSPTISVQRFGGSTFYNYLKSEPTEASISSSSPSNDEENLTESSSAPAAVSTTISTSDSSDNSSSSDDNEESNEDVVVSKASEDDAENLGTTPGPAGNVGEDGTTAPISSADSGNGGVDSSDGAEVVEAAPPAAGGDSSDDGNGNDGSLPSDQTPPPAEAVPGQPGEDDPDSSSSSSSSEESSSSSEEFKQAYKKVWEHNKVKSKDALLLARLQSKLTKKEKANKYSYY